MKLIIGGAYQGKLDHAKTAFNISEADVFTCCDTKVDFNSSCIYHLERFALACVRENKEPKEIFAANREKWENAVLIGEDISCGVVPVDAQMRAWREANGRLLNYLTGEAESVTRMFCGLAQRLK